ncbi:MAG: heavy metal-binding domain-containing protein [bacterium]|nr:heavy metal-binding domain-containing protein [bacterium]
MIIEDFKCPICGGPTAHEEQKKRLPRRKTIIYTCIDRECRTELSQDYDEKSEKYENVIYLFKTYSKSNDVWRRYHHSMLTPEQWGRISKGERIPELEIKNDRVGLCDSCGKKEGSFFPFVFIEDKQYCWLCAPAIMDKKLKGITVTTPMGIEGHKIIEYLDIESIEIVIGTGIFSEISTEIDDFFGARSTSFERKLQAAKKNALRLLKLKAWEKGANAIVGIDMDYTEFTGNRICVIANGTLVKIEPIS